MESARTGSHSPDPSSFNHVSVRRKPLFLQSLLKAAPISTHSKPLAPSPMRDDWPPSMESDRPQSVAVIPSSPLIAVTPLAYYPTHLGRSSSPSSPVATFPPMDPQVVCQILALLQVTPTCRTSVLNVITTILGREMPENLARVSTLAAVGTIHVLKGWEIHGEIPSGKLGSNSKHIAHFSISLLASHQTHGSSHRPRRIAQFACGTPPREKS